MPENLQYTANLTFDLDVGGRVIMAGNYRVFPTTGLGSQEIVGACLFTHEGFDADQIDLTCEQYRRLEAALIRV